MRTGCREDYFWIDVSRDGRDQENIGNHEGEEIRKGGVGGGVEYFVLYLALTVLLWD